jgi:monoamine oxidase
MEDNTYDVIVIGAGISGISASKILSAKQINHLILESRNRVGGRILFS